MSSAIVRTSGVWTCARRGGRCRARARRRHGFRHLEVRRVLVAVREGDGVLARVGEHVEFLGGAAADAARVGAHGAEAQLHAREDPRVRVVHGLVALLERGGVEVEGVGVLHRELARPHHAEARPDLVAELGLDLVEIDRQLPIALQLASREVGDHFLVRRAVAVRPVVPVVHAQQLRPELLPAARFLPELGRLHRRHQQLDRPGAVHFLADDGLDLAQHAQAQRQPRVQAGGETADQAGAQHQLVAHHLGVGGNVPQGIDRVGRKSHRDSVPGCGPPRHSSRGGRAPRFPPAAIRCAGAARYL